ncbi:hypothetical protein KKHLCK_08890 [Candidatus Electrothrix laxa]
MTTDNIHQEILGNRNIISGSGDVVQLNINISPAQESLLRQKKSTAQELMPSCTTQVQTPAGTGIGCFVAPGLLLTCAHLVAPSHKENAAITVSLGSGSVPAVTTRLALSANLVLLEIAHQDHACVYLHESLQKDDFLYGHIPGPSENNAITFQYEGSPEHGIPVRVHLQESRSDACGMPLVNLRTGGLCGMLIRNSEGTVQTLSLVPTAAIFNAFPELRPMRDAYHLKNRVWWNRLIPEFTANNIDFTSRIQEWRSGFTGREFVFEAIEQFTRRAPHGYFFIQGFPGIGKTALAAEFVHQHASIHHFNRRTLDLSRPADFLKNVCAQLIVSYGLDAVCSPRQENFSSLDLEELLVAAGRRLGEKDKLLIVIDALDEADRPKPGNNILGLPETLPDKIYLIVTMRPDKTLFPRMSCKFEQFVLQQDSKQNLEDIQRYLHQQTENSQDVQGYIARHRLETATFISSLTRKSQGNFIYLRFVLFEIEQGAYADLNVDALPDGLKNYYEDHWRRMRGQAGDEIWFTTKLPVIAALTAIKAPVHKNWIAAFSKVENRYSIQAVLDEWQQFLEKRTEEHKGRRRFLYNIYHKSSSIGQ